MGMFDDVPFEKPSASRGMFDDIPMEKAEPSAMRRAGSLAADVGRSAVAGLERGIVGLPGAVGDLDRFTGWVVDRGKALATGRTYDDVWAERDANERRLGIGRHSAIAPPSSESLIERFAPHGDYQPETTAGEYARTIGEFAPNAIGGGSALARLARVAVPAVWSEGAGKLTEGTAAEPVARFAGAIAGGAAVGAARGVIPRTAENEVHAKAGGLAPAEKEAALGRFDTLMADAKANGIPLSPAFAWDAATNGASDMAGVYRQVEGMGRMKAFNAQMPEAVEQAGRAQFDRLSPIDTNPSLLGERASETAREALDASPVGLDLEAARRAAGPRVTPDQAGQAIQRDLRGVRDQREVARMDQAAQDYRAARAAPETVGIERTVTVERPGEPIVSEVRPQYSRPQFQADAPGALGPAPRVSDRVPEGGRAQSLLDYLARNGGIPLDAETRAADLNRFYRPGAGTLARHDAPSWDDIRVRLHEQGFLPSEANGMARASDVRDMVLDAIHQEQIGRGRMVRMGEDAGAPVRHGDQTSEYADALAHNGSRLDRALTDAGVDPRTVHPDIRSRTLNAVMGDAQLDPLDAYERVIGSLREPPAPYRRTTPTTVTEEIPDVRFGQVDPQPALDALDRQLRTAKGDVRGSLEGIRRDLYERGVDPASGVRETDLSVEGLLHARERIDQHIEAAREAGDATKVRDLAIVRTSLDRQLKTVPAVARADQNFARNSQPLEPFGGNDPLGRVTARDDLTRRMQTPAEQVPGMLAGPTAQREALREGGAATREALQGRLVTQILDGATDDHGTVSTPRLRITMRENEDLLAQHPEARARLDSVMSAQRARDALRPTMVGRLAERDATTAKALNVLFPTGGDLLPNMEREVGAAVGTLARHRSTVARQLVRAKAESLFNASTKDLQSGSNEKGGAKFRMALIGNSQEAANFDASVRALPDGNTIADGFARFLDVLGATGLRQNVGSRTAYNQEFLEAARSGGKVEGAARTAAGGLVRWPKKIDEALGRWRLGRNLDELARLFSDPDAVTAFRGLIATADRGGNIVGPVSRLTAIAARSSNGDRSRETGR